MFKKVDNFLNHYGILGMRWGVRRRRKVTAGKSKTNLSDDYKKKEELKKRDPKSLSNQELKALNERMQLEKQYKDLTRNEISAGKRIVQEVLASAAKETAKNFVAKTMTKSLENLVEKKVKP